MSDLSKKDIAINRKTLAEIAVNEPEAFAEIVKTAAV
jgi:ribosomal protein L20